MADKNGSVYPSLTADQIIGHYRIEKKIGSGGMGDVYRAVDQRLNRPVAIKTLRPEFFDDPDKITRFTREAVTAAKINHPNIMSIYDVGEEKLEAGQRLYYIVLEFIEGDDLGSYVKNNKLSFTDLLRICEKLGSALAAAHKLSIVHRDIKLDNVMVNSAGDPKILDFGLAKPVAKAFMEESKGEGVTETVAREITQESKIVGTISYMSPEQARAETVDHRSDIFSFGILLYQLFTGKLPFEGSDRVSTIAKILEAPHDPIRIIDEALPTELERIINKCLQKKPDDRYQDTRDLVVDIRSLRRQFDSNVSETVSGTFESSQLQRSQERKLWGMPRPIGIASIGIAIITVALILFKVLDFTPRLSKNISDNALAILSFENLSDPGDERRFGQILQELVLTDLSDNSPIKLISSQRLFDVRKNLGYKDRVGISPDIASEVAREAGARVMLSGNLIELEGKWIVTCQLVDVGEGTIIKSHRLEGPDIFAVVDDLSNMVRADLAVSGDQEISDISVKEKTSVSMDAFRYYLTGVDLLNENDYENAIEAFEKAIEIDPEFNKAYYKMAIAQWWFEDEGSESGQKSINNILEHNRYSSERERTMALGALALMDRQYGNGIGIYEELTEQYPDDKEAWYGLGEALYHYSMPTRENALTAFERAIDLDVGFVLAYRHVFDLYFGYGRYDQAFERANNLIDVKPESSIGYRYLAKAAIFQGDSIQIERSIARAMKHHADPDELQGLYYDLFLAYAQIGSLPKANEFAKKTIEAAPQTRDSYRIKIWGELIRLTAMANQSNKTDSLIDAALTSDIAIDRKFNLVSNLAQGGYSNLKTRDKAREVLQRGMDLDTSGTSALMWSVAAQLALNDRQYDLAEEYSLKAIRHSESSQHDWASNVLFESYLFSRKYQKALESAYKRVERQPELSAGYGQVIKTYICSGQPGKADSMLQVALAKMDNISKKIMIFDAAAYSYRTLRDYNKALKLYQQALELDSSSLYLHTSAGRIYELLGDWNEAEKLYRMVLEKNPEDIGAMNSLADVSARKGDYAGAEQRLQEALALDSTNALLLRMFGYLYSAQGQYEKAIPYARRAVDRSGTFFSHNLLAWLMVASEVAIDSGLILGKMVSDNPPSSNPFDGYVHESPHVPLPDHTLGLGYLKLGEYERALKHLEKAAELRPADKKISEDLFECRSQLGSSM